MTVKLSKRVHDLYRAAYRKGDLRHLSDEELAEMAKQELETWGPIVAKELARRASDRAITRTVKKANRVKGEFVKSERRKEISELLLSAAAELEQAGQGGMAKMDPKMIARVKGHIKRRNRIFFELMRNENPLSEDEVAMLAAKFPERWAKYRRIARMMEM